MRRCRRLVVEVGGCPIARCDVSCVNALAHPLAGMVRDSYGGQSGGEAARVQYPSPSCRYDREVAVEPATV